MSGPFFYTVEFDANSDDLAALMDWNVKRHAPDMYKSGFHSTATYVPVGKDDRPSFLNLYELGSYDLWTSMIYTQAMARDPYSKALMSRRDNVQQTLYRYIDTSGRFLDAAEEVLNADAVSLFWLETADKVGMNIDLQWFVREAASNGSKGVRMMRKVENRPGASTQRPDLLVLVEWDDVSGRHGDLTRALAKVPWHPLKSVNDHFAKRVFPWPDGPERVARPDARQFFR